MSFSSFKDSKLIFENFRKFVTEEEESEEAAPVAGGMSTSDAYTMTLPEFVSSLQSNKKDFITAVMNGLKDGSGKDDRIKIEPATVKVSALRPTQAEVVFSKSIPFALQRPEVFMEYFTSQGPFKVGPPGNDAIITLNGSYILDGHHRWSSLFCVNPKSSMHTFDIKANVNPINMLKLMQASIKAYAGKVPSNKGGGVNLFTIDPKTLSSEVRKLITPDLAKQYIDLGLLGQIKEDVETGRAGRQEVEVYKKILGIYTRNVSLMQKSNTPAKGASSREPMPQTDSPAGSKVSAGGPTPAALEPLEKGMVDFRSPHAIKKAAE